MLKSVRPDALVPQHRAIRRIKRMVDHPLSQVSPTFDRMYADNGREAIPPEHPLKACLLMALFSVSSERQFCERLEYDLLFKWFSDLNIMDRSFKHSVFSKNSHRWLDDNVTRGALCCHYEGRDIGRLPPVIPSASVGGEGIRDALKSAETSPTRFAQSLKTNERTLRRWQRAQTTPHLTNRHPLTERSTHGEP